VYDGTTSVSSVSIQIFCEWRLIIELNVNFIVIYPSVIKNERMLDKDAVN